MYKKSLKNVEDISIVHVHMEKNNIIRKTHLMSVHKNEMNIFFHLLKRLIKQV